MNKPELRFKAADGSEFPDWEEKKMTEFLMLIFLEILAKKQL